MIHTGPVRVQMLKTRSTPVTARSRKLKLKWSLHTGPLPGPLERDLFYRDFLGNTLEKHDRVRMIRKDQVGHVTAVIRTGGLFMSQMPPRYYVRVRLKGGGRQYLIKPDECFKIS